MRASLSGLVFFFRSSFFFFRSSFSFSVLSSSCCFPLLLAGSDIGRLVHRCPLSRSVLPTNGRSGLRLRGHFILCIAPCLCIMFCTKLQTPAVCPIQDKCGCSGVLCALSPLARFLRQLRLHSIPTYSKGEPLRSPSVFSCYALRSYFFTP